MSAVVPVVESCERCRAYDTVSETMARAVKASRGMAPLARAFGAFTMLVGGALAVADARSAPWCPECEKRQRGNRA